ncbi:hypothetical protein [Kineosporia sp. A_224]|uniref:hypothetical protein n=1 Tax=Kineosporia sp. A_224 TaxID=1962180 RepID=UPI000B4A6FAC|nr:hypothetical protein [Kineosporia sp. A_224]
MASCRRCTTDLVHCHGTLVRHSGGDVECSDPGCEGRVAVHDFVIRCGDVESGCCAQPPVRLPVPAGRLPAPARSA